MSKIYGAGQARKQKNRHFNTMNRPGLRAGSIENCHIWDKSSQILDKPSHDKDQLYSGQIQAYL